MWSFRGLRLRLRANGGARSFPRRTEFLVAGHGHFAQQEMRLSTASESHHHIHFYLYSPTLIFHLSTIGLARRISRRGWLRKTLEAATSS